MDGVNGMDAQVPTSTTVAGRAAFQQSTKYDHYKSYLQPRHLHLPRFLSSIDSSSLPLLSKPFDSSLSYPIVHIHPELDLYHITHLPTH